VARPLTDVRPLAMPAPPWPASALRPAASRRVSRRFAALTAATTLAAAASVAVLTRTQGWKLDGSVRFWLLGAFVLAGELLPIAVPRRHGLDKVTLSTAFAFAVLMCSGILPACAVYAASSIIADVYARTSPEKVVFNASQYILSIAGAGAVLILAHAAPPVTLHASVVPALALAALACFLVNHVLAGTGAAVLADLPVRPYLADDVPFHALTAGCLFLLAPWVVASSDTSVALIPVAFGPVLAIYVAGRQAGVNAHRAYHDRLTGLPNRWLLSDSVTTAIESAERSGVGVAVMIVDLDDFKSINDTLGHHFGDRVLQLVAPRLADAVGSRGLLARLGGDEFAALVEGITEPGEAMRCADRLLAALEAPCEVDSLSLHVTASVGVACYPQHGRTVDELLRHADVAMYNAKGERSTSAMYAHEHDEYSIDRLALAAQLRRGIERGELVVHYQPKIPLGDHGVCAVEALVRWNHPQLGCIGPEGFVPLAEQTGLIKAVTEWVLDAALAQCAAWRREGLEVRFGVNVSTRSLLDHELPDVARSLLDRYAVPAELLQLEITESRFVADLGRAQTVLHELRAMGVTIAIDDFGTGYSSLSQLQQLPVDEIKIDRSFVMRMETDHDDGVLVRSIIELGRNLGLHVTAEGVETATVHHTLRGLGCDFAQGYFVSRPVPAGECRRVLAALAEAAQTSPDGKTVRFPRTRESHRQHA